ncbi:hypothetical protein [Paracnuella aquatica]|uniref:hypothetical protein n=1 Tax=Paracnuella aquatica TaxID=2268757 RepID=UPI000DEEE255|nr:hypothetical protein [Paracnuella aquatica]RPD49203.1 hypothetical protein DRJ53_08815 [Paracnuella aquatica]
MEKVWNWMLLNKTYGIGLAVGALGGFLYWKYVDCLTGTCSITSSPLNSTLYFALLGALLVGSFKKGSKEAAPGQENNNR